MDEVVLESCLEVNELIEEQGVSDGLIEHRHDLYHAVVGQILLDVVLEIDLGLSEVAHESILVDHALVDLLQSELQFPLNLLRQAIVALPLPVLVLSFESRDLDLIVSEEPLAVFEIVQSSLELLLVIVHLRDNVRHSGLKVTDRILEDGVLRLTRLIDELGHQLAFIPQHSHIVV